MYRRKLVQKNAARRNRTGGTWLILFAWGGLFTFFNVHIVTPYQCILLASSFPHPKGNPWSSHPLIGYEMLAINYDCAKKP
jgi:hypothetical protein